MFAFLEKQILSHCLNLVLMFGFSYFVHRNLSPNLYPNANSRSAYQPEANNVNVRLNISMIRIHFKYSSQQIFADRKVKVLLCEELKESF